MIPRQVQHYQVAAASRLLGTSTRACFSALLRHKTGLSCVVSSHLLAGSQYSTYQHNVSGGSSYTSNEETIRVLESLPLPADTMSILTDTEHTVENNVLVSIPCPVPIPPKAAHVLDILRDVAHLYSPQTELRVAGGWVRDLLRTHRDFYCDHYGVISKAFASSDADGDNQSTLHPTLTPSTPGSPLLIDPAELEARGGLGDLDIAISDMTGSDFATFIEEYCAERNIPCGFSRIQSQATLSRHLDTARGYVAGVSVDLVNLRTEDYASSGDTRVPTVEFGSISDDAMRRDFTVNALYYNIQTRAIEDWNGGAGLADLSRGLLRTPLPAEEIFLDDPLRVLRVIRFASRFSFLPCKPLLAAARVPEIREALLVKVSRERVGQELHKALTLEGANVGYCARLCWLVGVLDAVLPIGALAKAKYNVAARLSGITNRKRKNQTTTEIVSASAPPTNANARALLEQLPEPTLTDYALWEQPVARHSDLNLLHSDATRNGDAQSLGSGLGRVTAALASDSPLYPISGTSPSRGVSEANTLGSTLWNECGASAHNTALLLLQVKRDGNCNTDGRGGDAGSSGGDDTGVSTDSAIQPLESLAKEMKSDSNAAPVATSTSIRTSTSACASSPISPSPSSSHSLSPSTGPVYSLAASLNHSVCSAAVWASLLLPLVQHRGVNAHVTRGALGLPAELYEVRGLDNQPQVTSQAHSVGEVSTRVISTDSIDGDGVAAVLARSLQSGVHLSLPTSLFHARAAADVYRVLVHGYDNTAAAIDHHTVNTVGATKDVLSEYHGSAGLPPTSASTSSSLSTPVAGPITSVAESVAESVVRSATPVAMPVENPVAASWLRAGHPVDVTSVALHSGAWTPATYEGKAGTNPPLSNSHYHTLGRSARKEDNRLSPESACHVLDGTLMSKSQDGCVSGGLRVPEGCRVLVMVRSAATEAYLRAIGLHPLSSPPSSSASSSTSSSTSSCVSHNTGTVTSSPTPATDTTTSPALNTAASPAVEVGASPRIDTIARVLPHAMDTLCPVAAHAGQSLVAHTAAAVGAWWRVNPGIFEEGVFPRPSDNFSQYPTAPSPLPASPLSLVLPRVAAPIAQVPLCARLAVLVVDASGKVVTCGERTQVDVDALGHIVRVREVPESHLMSDVSATGVCERAARDKDAQGGGQEESAAISFASTPASTPASTLTPTLTSMSVPVSAAPSTSSASLVSFSSSAFLAVLAPYHVLPAALHAHYASMSSSALTLKHMHKDLLAFESRLAAAKARGDVLYIAAQERGGNEGDGEARGHQDIDEEKQMDVPEVADQVTGCSTREAQREVEGGSHHTEELAALLSFVERDAVFLPHMKVLMREYYTLMSQFPISESLKASSKSPMEIPLAPLFTLIQESRKHLEVVMLRVRVYIAEAKKGAIMTWSPEYYLYSEYSQSSQDLCNAFIQARAIQPLPRSLQPSSTTATVTPAQHTPALPVPLIPQLSLAVTHTLMSMLVQPPQMIAPAHLRRIACTYTPLVDIVKPYYATLPDDIRAVLVDSLRLPTNVAHSVSTLLTRSHWLAAVAEDHVRALHSVASTAGPAPRVSASTSASVGVDVATTIDMTVGLYPHQRQPWSPSSPHALPPSSFRGDNAPETPTASKPPSTAGSPITAPSALAVDPPILPGSSPVHDVIPSLLADAMAAAHQLRTYSRARIAATTTTCNNATTTADTPHTVAQIPANAGAVTTSQPSFSLLMDPHPPCPASSPSLGALVAWCRDQPDLTGAAVILAACEVARDAGLPHTERKYPFLAQYLLQRSEAARTFANTGNESVRPLGEAWGNVDAALKSHLCGDVEDIVHSLERRHATPSSSSSSSSSSSHSSPSLHSSVPPASTLQHITPAFTLNTLFSPLLSAIAAQGLLAPLPPASGTAVRAAVEKLVLAMGRSPAGTNDDTISTTIGHTTVTTTNTNALKSPSGAMDPNSSLITETGTATAAGTTSTAAPAKTANAEKLAEEQEEVMSSLAKSLVTGIVDRITLTKLVASLGDVAVAEDFDTRVELFTRDLLSKIHK